MIDDCLKLITYFGERDRANGSFLADALVDVYERRAFQTSIVMRGIEGFGIKHHLQTARLLTLSEGLPTSGRSSWSTPESRQGTTAARCTSSW